MNNCVNHSNQKFLINQHSRPIYDSCEVSLEKANYQKLSDRSIKNFHNCGCSAPEVQKLAYSQPSLQYRDGYGFTSMDGCNIDKDSDIKLNKDRLTNKNTINILNARSHSTTPYMGRGRGNPELESEIVQGMTTDDLYTNKFIENKDLSEYRFTPLLPHLSKNIQNPKNLIIEDADSNFVRGGLSSRQLIRDKNYLKKCGYTLYGKEANSNQ